MSAHVASTFAGYILPEGKYLPSSRVSGRAVISSYSCHGDPKLFLCANVLQKDFHVYDPKRVSLPFLCTANSNNHRRNPDFSRQKKGLSKGKSRHYQDRDKSESLEETDQLSSKNGPLLSLSSNPRYQSTATPGRREKEIVELFRKVQAQLRARAAIKEEKKIEASQQGQGERGTVDSLLKLLRKHSVDQGKKAGDEEFNLDQPERSNPFEDEQSPNFFDSSNITSGEVHEPGPVSSTRPVSNFRRKSPVPRVKYQPVYSAEEGIGSSSPLKSQWRKKNTDIIEPYPEVPEPISLDVPDEVFTDDPSDSSDIDETYEEITESSATENAELSSLKLSELRALAKSRGIKGYSKLKKADLVELLSGGA